MLLQELHRYFQRADLAFERLGLLFVLPGLCFELGLLQRQSLGLVAHLPTQCHQLRAHPPIHHASVSGRQEIMSGRTCSL